MISYIIIVIVTALTTLTVFGLFGDTIRAKMNDPHWDDLIVPCRDEPVGSWRGIDLAVVSGNFQKAFQNLNQQGGDTS